MVPRPGGWVLECSHPTHPGCGHCALPREESRKVLEDAPRFVAVQHVMATFPVLLWEISAVVYSSRCRATECSRLMAPSLFAAINKLLFHKLSFNVFCCQNERASCLGILVKIWSCFRKVLPLSVAHFRSLFLKISFECESYS